MTSESVQPERKVHQVYCVDYVCIKEDQITSWSNAAMEMKYYESVFFYFQNRVYYFYVCFNMFK